MQYNQVKPGGMFTSLPESFQLTDGVLPDFHFHARVTAQKARQGPCLSRRRHASSEQRVILLNSQPLAAADVCSICARPEPAGNGHRGEIPATRPV